MLSFTDPCRVEPHGSKQIRQSNRAREPSAGRKVGHVWSGLVMLARRFSSPYGNVLELSTLCYPGHYSQTTTSPTNAAVLPTNESTRPKSASLMHSNERAYARNRLKGERSDTARNSGLERGENKDCVEMRIQLSALCEWAAWRRVPHALCVPLIRGSESAWSESVPFKAL